MPQFLTFTRDPSFPVAAHRRRRSLVKPWFTAWLSIVFASGKVTTLSASIFLVTTTNDTGSGSFRQAILDSNNSPGRDEIRFAVPGPGTHTIAPRSILPPLLDPVMIDATTQAGYSGQPLIVLNGVNAGNNAGLRVLAGDSTIRGLVINRFAGCGIQIEGPGTNFIQANLIGTGPAGTAAHGNGLEGVWIYNSSGNQIGGLLPGQGNLVSGNGDSGIYIQNGCGNIVCGNTIGLAADGTSALGNDNNGITLYQAPGNLIGVETGVACNLISGNRGSGVYLYGQDASSNRIQGNWIGLNAAGTAAISNAADGITLNAAPGNLIGGLDSGNVISGNGKAGVALLGPQTVGNRLEGNIIGTDPGGGRAIGNWYAGVSVAGAVSNRIGAAAATARNLISGNRQDGIFLSTNSSGNSIAGNLIGTDQAGLRPVANLFNGISVISAGSNQIGAANAAGRNVLSGNRLNGLLLAGGGAAHNLVQGNYVGTTVAGDAALPNGRSGIEISAAPDNQIGGSEPGAGNLLSGNVEAGVCLVGPGAAGNTILGNRIGTDAAGLEPLGNGLEGIYLESAPGNTLGGALPGAGNLISGNQTRGIYLTNSAWVVIQGNLIGTKADASSRMGNTFHNIELESGSTNCLIGGTGAAANVIAFAGGVYAGVRLRSGTLNNRIMGNSIFGNGALGIDLGNVGVNANDLCDSDTGANGLQNFPILSAAVADAASMAVRGTLNSTAEGAFTVEIFASPQCDEHGNGEGQLCLGQTVVTTGADCRGAFAFTVSVAPPEGMAITATATDANGNTSEFCPCITLAKMPELQIHAGSQNEITVSWTSLVPGLALVQTRDLKPPIQWEPVSDQILRTNNQCSLTFGAQPGARFYRLIYE